MGNGRGLQIHPVDGFALSLRRREVKPGRSGESPDPVLASDKSHPSALLVYLCMMKQPLSWAKPCASQIALLVETLAEPYRMQSDLFICFNFSQSDKIASVNRRTTQIRYKGASHFLPSPGRRGKTCIGDTKYQAIDFLPADVPKLSTHELLRYSSLVQSLVESDTIFLYYIHL